MNDEEWENIDNAEACWIGEKTLRCIDNYVHPMCLQNVEEKKGKIL